MLSSSQNALLAKGSYESKDRALEYAKSIHKDFIIDDEFSNNHTTVYHNPTTKQTVVSHRGTKLTDKSDLVADSLYFLNLGKHSSRYKNAKTVTKKIISKYGFEGTSCTGHSLGANLCSDTSKDTGIAAETFSKGKTLLPKTKAKNEKSTRVIGDPFSSSGKIKLPKSLNPHSVGNF